VNVGPESTRSARSTLRFQNSASHHCGALSRGLGTSATDAPVGTALSIQSRVSLSGARVMEGSSKRSKT
jgi:hypothetical protein